MRWGLISVLLVLVGCETPTVRGYLSGTWRQVGATYDVDISFTVYRNSVTHLRLTPGAFAIQPWPCPDVQLFDSAIERPIVNDGFTATLVQGGVTATVLGRFDYFGTGIFASGTVRLEGPGCTAMLPFDWNADQGFDQ